MAVKDYQDLEIICKPDEAVAFIAAITERLDDGWTRHPQEEDRLNKEALSSRRQYCFSCTEKPNRQAANLWLVESNDRLEISNIVPAKMGQLSYDEYNSILTDFYNSYIRSQAEAQGLEVKLSQPFSTLEDWVHPETAQALKLFSRNANMGTGRGHPCDNDRWMAFILQAYTRKEKLTTQQLRRWLVEDEGWPEDIARSLSSDYENALEVLEYYDKHR